ncbi:MAG: sodium:proline symporter [Gemmatimonadales bacterium]|nr:MAG: sodium:proline symporter [Gemmatimonadales bacterium]
MKLSASDWLVVAAYFALAGALGILAARRAGRSLADYFVSGRSLPWWLAGTSMVATTFAADTPLAVTGMVARHGVSANWLWWNLALSGLLTVFFFSRLWRRAGVLTDIEFTELRYGGKAAALLRGVRALYLAGPINLIIMGWVTRAMVTILETALGISGWSAALLLFSATAAYATLSGMWGVILTDFFQFAVAMTGSIVLAIAAVKAVGGLDQLAAGAARHFGSAEAALGILPPPDSPWLPLSTLVVFLAVQWWAVWYPGAEPGGGGYVAQRMLATKDERHSLLATLWFNVAHYAVRPWPWILVGLATVILYPGLENPEQGYVRAMVDLLGSPWKGLLLAAFAAAYMSTISTHLNWGASYLVNDVYLRFLRPRAGAREQVRVGRWATVVLMVLAFGVMGMLETVEAGWRFLLAISAGTGLVLILRWYWWRVNAWSELSAMAASLITSLTFQFALGYDPTDPSGPGFAVVIVGTVAVTTMVWIGVTLLTPPEPAATLESFYRRVRPGGPGWRAVALKLGHHNDPIPGGWLSWVNWVAGVSAVYLTLAGTGELLLGQPARGWLALGAAAGAMAVVARNLKKDREFSARH